MTSRRRFVKVLGGLGGLAVAGGLGTRFKDKWKELRKPEGAILGASANVGHLLRDGIRGFAEPTTEIRASVAIVGGGIAGLSAAWKLARSGIDDFVVLELEREPGGNSRFGRNSVCGYPWGAHYVPVPGPESRAVVEMFEDLGVIEGRDAAGRPRYDETFVCASPQERLFVHGTWQEGLVPQLGADAKDREEYARFFAEMDKLKRARGGDGRPAFTIPVDASSRDPRWRSLDKITMERWLVDRSFKSARLRWYLDYCCRDDYGCGIARVSAWAGLHYFASRASADVLTWPEGNGWLVGRLRKKLGSRIRTGALAVRVQTAGNEALVDCYEPETKQVFRIRAKAAIFAGPRFAALKTIGELRGQAPSYAADFHYSPWMVANLTVAGIPGGEGAATAWDNVFFESRSLGYVVATHQLLESRPKRSVLTYYLPLDHAEPAQARREAAARSYADWRDSTLADLERVHPGVGDATERLDVWLWGHGMIRPSPGFIWGESRRRALLPIGRVHFAHSDMSGISIFEEAQYRGIVAAQEVMKRMSHGYREST